ncbi:class I adenylate-forming enzyme family protein [Mycobacterium colombiense]
MSISLLLDMATDANPDRLAVVDGDTRLTASELSDYVAGAAELIAAQAVQHVVYLGTGGVMLPLGLLAAARAGVVFTPLNYRLSADTQRVLIDRLPNPLIIADDDYRDKAVDIGKPLIAASEFMAQPRSAAQEVTVDPDSAAVVLFTSGTTSRPKAVELTHNNLVSYITGTIEFASAEADEAALICVPPYHVAGVGAALSNLYAGRRMVYLRQFEARQWTDLVNRERITTATVVPTMLDRIVAVLQTDPVPLPTLRNLAYGGSKIALPLVHRALDLLPDVGFVNAYGLTETSSTISVLTPDDHRAARRSSDRNISRRLGSVGRPVPGIELQIRATDGTVLGPNQQGELFIRGPQVSGRYSEIGSVLDGDGWFPTRDIAWTDDEGYLFIGGRSDDTIIRGGENIAPAEIEDVLVEHPTVRDVAVVGVTDAEWGQIIVAVVVPADGADPDVGELRTHVRDRLRGSRTPDRVVFRDELPTNATGKVLRRQLADELASGTRGEIDD